MHMSNLAFNVKESWPAAVESMDVSIEDASLFLKLPSNKIMLTALRLQTSICVMRLAF